MGGRLFQIPSKPAKPRPSPSGDAAKGPGLQEHAAEGQKGLGSPRLPRSSPNPAGSPGREEKQGCDGCSEGRVMPPGVSQPGGNREGRVGEGSREAL